MTEKVIELRRGGYTDKEISSMLSIPMSEIVGKIVPTSDETKDELGNLKTAVFTAASSAVSQIQNNLKGNTDANEVAKLTDSLAKLHTAFFKEDKGTTVNIMQNNLSMFKESLKR